MKNYDYSNHVQKEAILNECKGNLFEFLVTQKLSVKSGIESFFLTSLPDDFKIQMTKYEQLIRESEPQLLVSLPHLAQSTGDFIWENFELDKIKFFSWNVVGKIFSSNDSGVWNEADVVGSFFSELEERRMVFSLKLTRDNSYTNTKSAGAKSFLSKYFTSYGNEVFMLQEQFNKLVDESFIKMAHKLYEINDITFNGKFDELWFRHFSELPGELPDPMRLIVYENYHSLACRLHNYLERLFKIDKSLFLDSLKPLCGFGSEDINQVNCFHKDYKLKKISFYNSKNLFLSDNNIKILPIKNGASSIEVLVNDFSLQIRIKPMNKFTSPAYKINCAIRTNL